MNFRSTSLNPLFKFFTTSALAMIILVSFSYGQASIQRRKTLPADPYPVNNGTLRAASPATPVNTARVNAPAKPVAAATESKARTRFPGKKNDNIILAASRKSKGSN